MPSVFCDKPCNTDRQPELDLGKAIPVLCLAFIHCIIECTPEEKLVSGIPYLFDTVVGGALSAPMYMFAMGIGMVYTKHNTAKDLAERGIHLCVCAYALNICRYLIPYLFGYAVTKDSEHFLGDLLYKTLENDILLFASLSFLCAALFKRFNISHLVMLTAGAVFSVIGTQLNGIDFQSIPGNIFLGYLMGTEDGAGLVRSYFPFLNWFIVPASGCVFGYYLQRVRDKKKFYAFISAPALILAAAYFVYGIHTERGMFGEGQNCYYHIITSDVIASIMAAMGLLGVYYVLVPLLPKKLSAFFTEVSRNITYVYCIHWIFVVWITNVFIYIITGTQELPVWETLLLAAAIDAVSVTLAHYINRRRKHEKKKKSDV